MNKMKPEPLTVDMCLCRWPTGKLLGVGKSTGVSTFPSTTEQWVSSPMSMHFNWAEDAVAMPIEPTPHAQDFSGLKMGCKQPFGALWRRTRQRRAPPPFLVPPQPFITQRHPSSIGPGRPVIIVPFGEAPASAPILKLDWDWDPRFMDLSCALRALGWVPACWVLYYFIFYINYRIFLAKLSILLLYLLFCSFSLFPFHDDEDVTFLDVGRWSSVCGYTYSR